MLDWILNKSSCRSFYNHSLYLCLSLFEECPLKSLIRHRRLSTTAYGISNLIELLLKYLILFKPIAEHTALSTFIQLVEST